MSFLADLEDDLEDHPFIPSKTKAAYPFCPEVQEFLDQSLKPFSSLKWHEAFSLERTRRPYPIKGYPLSSECLTLSSSLRLRGQDHEGKPFKAPLVLQAKRLPCQDSSPPQSYNPHLLVDQMDEIERRVDKVASDPSNPVYKGAIWSTLIESLGLRQVLPWPLVLRKPATMVLRGKRDFVYYLGTWVECSEGTADELAKEGLFEEDGLVLSLFFQLLVPLLTLHLAKLPLTHSHLTLEAIRYQTTSLKSFSFGFEGQEVTFETGGYRFFLEDWDHGEMKACGYKDAMALAFSLEPWLNSKSALKSLVHHLTHPFVNTKVLSLEASYPLVKKSLRALLDFVPDNPQDYSLHRVLDILVSSFLGEG